MQKKNSRFEFFAMLTFLAALALLLSNGFVSRISAQDNQVDVYQQVAPLGEVLGTIQDEYVRDVDIDALVEGALRGMMRSLDEHSSFVSARDLTEMREDTRGEFEGIGVQIRQSESGHILVVAPMLGSPAAAAGMLPNDVIIAIAETPTQGMTTSDAADLIRGPRGTTIMLTVRRELGSGPEILELEVKRDKVPLQSIEESGLMPDGIGYARVKDFKEKTAEDLRKRLRELLDQGMTGFVLDMRWNPGGLLNASKEVCELFLPKGSLVTYTQGRPRPDGRPNRENDMRLITERRPVLPEGFPVVVLVNRNTASSAEIVTGALQFHQRGIIVGEKTFGKGSVQTIIPLNRPRDSALRLTTALYYTPADVTIDHQGILPDVDEPMEEEYLIKLVKQMNRSYEADPMSMGILNHGLVSGYQLPEGKEPELDEEGNPYEIVEDKPLLRAVEILREDTVWDNLLKKYHKDVRETQMAESDAQAKAELVGGDEVPVEEPAAAL